MTWNARWRLEPPEFPGHRTGFKCHYTDVHAIAPEITGNSNVCSTSCSAWQQKNPTKSSHYRPLRGESTENRWFPSQRASNVECFSYIISSSCWHHRQYRRVYPEPTLEGCFLEKTNKGDCLVFVSWHRSDSANLLSVWYTIMSIQYVVHEHPNRDQWHSQVVQCSEPHKQIGFLFACDIKTRTPGQ